MAPGVGVLEVDTLVEAMRNSCLQTIVGRVCRSFLIRDTAKYRPSESRILRVSLIEHSACVCIAGCSSRSGNRGIDLATGQQVMAHGSDVANFKKIPFLELPLRIKVVLVRVGSYKASFVNGQTNGRDVGIVE